MKKKRTKRKENESKVVAERAVRLAVRDVGAALRTGQAFVPQLPPSTAAHQPG